MNCLYLNFNAHIYKGPFFKTVQYTLMNNWKMTMHLGKSRVISCLKQFSWGVKVFTTDSRTSDALHTHTQSKSEIQLTGER